MPPKLNRVIRLDSLPLNQTFFTPEGYLIDKPIVTSTGIFEYHNDDGSVRRELRLPEEVFSATSLATYKGKPLIITHDAGLVDKKNVSDFQIGTILSNGYRDGDDVRAEIVINDTDAMKECGYKELSLGYNLDLDETSGTWHGQHYDAIQRNITINHLALVREARAGDQARLNIDSRDKQIPKGVKVMAKTQKRTRRADSVLSPEEFQKAIEEYKARRAKRMETQKDAENEEEAKLPENEVLVEPKADVPVEKEEDEDDVPVEEKVEEVRENYQEEEKNEDEEEVEEEKDPKLQMDEDMETLFDIIDTLLAEREFKKGQPQEGGQGDDAGYSEPLNKLEKFDEDDEEFSEDEDDEEFSEDEEDEEFTEEEEEFSEDECDEEHSDEDEEFSEDSADFPGEIDSQKPISKDDLAIPEKVSANKMNADSVDKMIRQRIKIGIMADRLHMDGVEHMSVNKAKKTLIKAVRPNTRLDGKSETYVNAMFDLAYEETKANSSVGYQKKQMFNKKSRMDARNDKASANKARMRMIDRQNKKEDK